MTYFEKVEEVNNKNRKILRNTTLCFPGMIVLFYVSISLYWTFFSYINPDIAIPCILFIGFGIPGLLALFFIVKGFIFNRKNKKFLVSEYDRLSYMAGVCVPEYKDVYEKYKTLIDNKDYSQVLKKSHDKEKALMYARYLEIKDYYEKEIISF